MAKSGNRNSHQNPSAAASQKNYILDNKNKITNHEIPVRAKQKEEAKGSAGANPVHKNFGKIPN